MPLMVVDGAAGDCEASTSSGMWSAGRCFLALVLGEICGENDYVRIRRLSGKACWLFYQGKVYRMLGSAYGPESSHRSAPAAW